MDTYGNYWHLWQYYPISSIHSFQWQIWHYWHIWQSWHIWQYRSVSPLHSFHSHYIPFYHTADTVTLAHTAIPTYMAMLLCIIHAFIHLHSSQLHSCSSLAFIHLHSSIHPFILSYIPVAHSHSHPSMIIQFQPFCFVYWSPIFKRATKNIFGFIFCSRVLIRSTKIFILKSEILHGGTLTYIIIIGEIGFVYSNWKGSLGDPNWHAFGEILDQSKMTRLFCKQILNLFPLRINGGGGGCGLHKNKFCIKVWNLLLGCRGGLDHTPQSQTCIREVKKQKKKTFWWIKSTMGGGFRSESTFHVFFLLLM